MYIYYKTFQKRINNKYYDNKKLRLPIYTQTNFTNHTSEQGIIKSNHNSGLLLSKIKLKFVNSISRSTLGLW